MSGSQYKNRGGFIATSPRRERSDRAGGRRCGGLPGPKGPARINVRWVTLVRTVHSHIVCGHRWGTPQPGWEGKSVLTFRGNEVRRWLAGVGAIAEAVAAQRPLSELLDLIARTACELTGYEGAGVLLADDVRERLIIRGSHGLTPGYVERVNGGLTIELGSGPLADGPSSRAFRQAEPVPIADIRGDRTFEPWSKLATDHEWRAIVAVPLMVAGEPVGTLNCYRNQVHEFGDDELALLATLASQAGTALQSARLIRSLTEQSDMLEQAEDIHRELTAVALRSGDIQGVTEALAGLLARPVLVTDDAGAVAANAHFEGVLLDPEKEPVGLSTEWIDEDAASGRITVPVRLGRETVARLWLPGRLADLTELQRRALEHAAVVCALEALRTRTAIDVEWRLRGDLLTDLLSETSSAASVTARAAALGHDLARPHTVMLAAPDVPAAANRSRLLLGATQTVADRCEPRPLVTSWGEHVIVLWPDTRTGIAAADAARELRSASRRTLGSTTITVTVGHRCEEVDAVRSAVRTARGALELARLHGSDRIVTLPDLGVYGLLLQLNDPRELVRFIEHTLRPLREYDERKKATLVATLRVFLDQRMNVARTAGALFVHPNTVALRLKRVEELIDISVQQPEDLLRVKVALMAEDVLGTGTPSNSA
ncbi:helix-turn-helix domain-containing protein [Actinomycetospora soli]|uniref:helix-turn-helix domain-containing protein n=1 Tax=Actinomycetospora soli TaxID=2893887 RepID=UPI001E594907|nr:GAF domain-containing protein [Actinomycetospora soli]MCD2191489.1 GAF domain-containing protein [Actinomycetospora soli]